MKKILIIISIVSLSGCSMLGLIPSKWDVNEAKTITDIQITTRYFDCSNASKQITKLQKQITWFEIYSQFKGSRDVSAIFVDISKTVNDFKARTDKGPISPMYCELKKKILIQQSDITAKAIQGRFQ
jgi:hypothetical protein